MKIIFYAFSIALQLLTRLPGPALSDLDENEKNKAFGLSVIFYPLVGLIIGAILVLLSEGFSYLALPSKGLIEAGILLTIWVLITGALHLDGLADSADAWLGGYGDRERTLAIMKDPYSGPVAVVVVVLLLLLKFSGLTVVEPHILLLAPVLARTAIMVLLATTPYVRAGGMGETAVNHLPKTAVWFVVLLVLIFATSLLGEYSAGLLVLLGIGYLLRRLMLKRINGTTGDTAGAMLEVMEVSTLLVFIILYSV